jgi:hypothetical protein
LREKRIEKEEREGELRGEDDGKVESWKEGKLERRKDGNTGERGLSGEI